MQLVLSEENLRFAWGSSAEYWFSRTDYRIHKLSDIPDEDCGDLINLGYVPFVTVSNEEVIRAYIKSLNNKKLSAVFDSVNGEECVETFWKYFNAYKDISLGFNDFEKKYLTEKVIEWCNENAVQYKQ